ncbi:MAG: hypothetical protein GY862_03660, partial [Gammaproteobacteria bacterium]|nr:hypothetical protein [Gammaproteobacteria bacterium]
IRNIYQDLKQAELTMGVTKLHKMWWKNKNTGNFSVSDPRIYSAFPMLSELMLFLIAGTKNDTVATLPGTPRRYGCGNISEAISAGATQVKVIMKGGITYNAVMNGDTVCITSLENPDTDTAGEQEFRFVTGRSYNGDEVTITLDAPLENAYPLSRSIVDKTIKTRVSSCITNTPNPIKAGYENLAVTSSGGSIDKDGAPIVADNTGAIVETFIFTFDSSTTGTVAGSTLGNLGAFNISSQFSPNNASFGRPYFTIPAAFWTGSWMTGDQLVFELLPSAMPVWYELIVPAGTTPVGIEIPWTWIAGNAGST